MIAVVVRVWLVLLNRVSFGVGPSRKKAHAVHEQLGESAQLTTHADEGRRCNVVHEKGTIVSKENATPPEKIWGQYDLTK